MASSFDSWESYFWEPGGSVLRNLYGERDGAALARREYAETAAQELRIARGEVHIPRTYDAEHLRAIHKQLFGNIYEWAGEYRTVGIEKNRLPFAEPADIDRYLADAHRLVDTNTWSTMSREEFAHAAADVFAHVNHAHPFREGNGRASKLFMQHVAELSPWRIEYDPKVSGVSAEMWNQAAMLSGPDRGQHRPVPDTLRPVFHAMAQPRHNPHRATPATGQGSVRGRLAPPRSPRPGRGYRPGGPGIGR
jgi:cell filamentation protein